MAPLVTITEVVTELRLDGPDDEAARIAEEATDIVINYLGVAPDKWTVETVPARVRSAILIAARNRYDGGDVLTETVRSLIERDRIHGIA